MYIKAGHKMLDDYNLLILEDFIKEILLDEAKKKKAKKKKASKKRSAKKGSKNSKRKNKRPGRKDYYKNLTRKGKNEMEREINKCSGVGKGKNWKRPKSCYDNEWEADKEKYRSKK
jgi:hypothetical protein